MNNVVQVTKKQEIETVRVTLEKMKGQLAMALPTFITADRMCRIVMTAIQQNPKLLECTRTSLYAAIMKASQLGIEPDGNLGHGYLIPFKKNSKVDGKWVSQLEVQFIPGYKGLIDLARRSGEVSNIIAKEVYENDDFEIDWANEMPFRHKPFLNGDRGAIKFFWALARFKDGGFHWDYMTKEEIETIKNNSNGKDNDVWNKNFVEMAKKTVIRRIAKYLPMSVQRAAQFDQLQEAGRNPSVTSEGDIVIDNDFTPTEEPQKPADKSSKLDAFAGGQTIDQETGEILEEKPPFDFETADLSTVEKTKAAANDFLDFLKVAKDEERIPHFMACKGSILADALKKHGLGLDKQNFEKLGIKL